MGPGPSRPGDLLTPSRRDNPRGGLWRVLGHLVSNHDAACRIEVRGLGKVFLTPPRECVQKNPGKAVITLSGARNVWINGLVIVGPKGMFTSLTCG